MLDFHFVVPKWRPMDVLRWHVPLPRYADLRANPVGLRHNGEYLIKGMCSPYYASMSEAVDAVVAEKFGPHGIYRDRALFRRIYQQDFGDRYLAEASDYVADVIECARDICTYIYETHGRFPAHCETIHVSGIWIQVHHVEEVYYERFFRRGLTPAQEAHQRDWHSAG